MDKKKIKKIEWIAQIAEEGDIAIVKHISDLEDEFDSKLDYLDLKNATSIASVDKKASDALILAEKASKLEPKDGYTPKKGVDYKDGENYILTEKDKKDIAKIITVPVVEKVVEKRTEIIKEIPVVRETVKETIRNDLSPQEIRDLLELLQDDDRLDAKYIKNLPKQLNPGNGPMLHTPALSNLPDVDVAGILSGQTIQWNGTRFVAASGGGVTISDATGTVDSANVTFTVTSTPTFILSDNSVFFEGFGYSRSGTTITMFFPPQYYVKYAS